MFKDILELENIRNASKLNDLLKLIAFQIGSEVSLNELGNSLGLAKQTVGRYLDLLEKAFIIFNVRGYSSNLRKEVNKTSRYYFWDNGIRNAVINNFNLPDTRMDMGMLWKNKPTKILLQIIISGVLMTSKKLILLKNAKGNYLDTSLNGILEKKQKLQRPFLKHTIIHISRLLTQTTS